MMTRKIFQELQQSTVNVRGSTKMKEGENMNKEAVDTNENIKSKKLSTVPAKHSKRKNVGRENKTKKLPKAVTKKEAVSKAKACTQKEDLQATVTLNQSRLETYLYSCASTSDISNDSAAQDLGNCTTMNKSISEDIQLLTSEKPSQAYWQEIAEQRRIAHEKTVLENEMLADEINVLQTENMQLKSALEAAEILLKHAGLLDE